LAITARFPKSFEGIKKPLVVYIATLKEKREIGLLSHLFGTNVSREYPAEYSTWSAHDELY
jgi:hypothetical protein